jgi:hypothetical protein
MKIAPFFLALGLLVQTTAFATQPLLEVIDFKYIGAQCEELNTNTAETPNIVLSVDEQEQSLEIPFGTSFDAFTDEDNYRVRNRCKVEVKLKVPEGYQVAPDYVTYLGAADISPEGRGTVTARYRLAGEPSPTAVEIFPGGFVDGFEVESPHAIDPQWSQCGGELDLIADANIVVTRSQAEAGIADSSIYVDDAIGKQVLSCGYTLQPCHHSEPID